jgi:hypothetical protein
MDKGKYLRMAKTVVFLVCFSLFQFVLLWNLRSFNDSAWPQITKIVLGLISWLVLWQLSSASYEGHRGVGRWVQPSGLLKAFLVLIIYVVLGTWALWNYMQIVTRPYLDMADVSMAIEFFHSNYKVYPGNPGPITTEVDDELKGSADAKINVRHTDYLTQVRAKGVKDDWGHPYYFRIDPPDPKYPDSPNIVVISCGPNGIFENGKGDDLCFPPVVRH